MTRIALAAVALLLAGSSLAGCSAAPPSTPTAQPGAQDVDVASAQLVRLKKQTAVPDCPLATGRNDLPVVTLRCLGGGRDLPLDRLAGPAVLNFWASWCTVCRAEMPLLADFARTNRSVAVLGVDYADQQPDKALELARDTHVGYPLVADPLSELDLKAPIPKIIGLPFTMVIDGQGHVVAKRFGEFTSAAQLRQFVSAALPGSG